LAKMVYRIVRYGESKSQFSIVRKAKPRQVGFSSFPLHFPSPAWMSRLHPEYKYGVEIKPRQDRRARVEPKVRKFLMSLDISETLCPSRVRPARQVLFMSFPLFAVMRTPIRKSVVFGIAGNCAIRFLPGKLAAISTYSSFSWCFLLLFMYTVFVHLFLYATFRSYKVLGASISVLRRAEKLISGENR
jgi:hypothetical protein